MNRIAALTALLAAAPAAAQSFPCPAFQAGWTVSSPGPITSVGYDQNSKILSVIWNAKTPTQFWPVPISVMIAFNQSRNLLQTYNSYVAGVYNALLLQENVNCPVVQEGGGYIWTRRASAIPMATAAWAGTTPLPSAFS